MKLLRRQFLYLAASAAALAVAHRMGASLSFAAGARDRPDRPWRGARHCPKAYASVLLVKTC